jgi:hypothetical protein
MFCGASCTGKFYTTTPEGKARFYTKERAEKIGESKRAWHQDNPEASKKIVETMRNLTPEQENLRLQKVSLGLKRLGRWPGSNRGGNGTGPTVAETALLHALPNGIWNYVVHTGKWNGSGYPASYKVDWAYPQVKVAVEADGLGHRAYRQIAKDKKKMEFLQGLGWTVLRFTNKQILDHPEEVAAEVSRSITLKLMGTPVTG